LLGESKRRTLGLQQQNSDFSHRRRRLLSAGIARSLLL
jgi:hypothetical protein